MKNKTLLITTVFAIVFFVILGVTYKQMSKPIGELFSRYDQITGDQHLLDTTITLLNLNTNKKKVVDLNKKVTLSFRGVYNKTGYDDEDIIKEFISKKKELYIIVNDTIELSKILKKSLQLYYININDLPFKHKKLLYPYTIVVDNKKILRIDTDNLKNMIND